jgi:ribosomal protein S18 acetylase RimI-like enzyme
MPRKRATKTIVLRPAAPADEPFLWEVYASTREDELALTDWDDAQKRAFVDMQFGAQHLDYHQNYPDASFQVIVVDGQAAGRLYVHRRLDEIHIIDIALLKSFRRQGIGTRLLRELHAEASAVGLPLRIHVERFNPALNLYVQLGFRVVEDQGVYLYLEWPPEPGQSGAERSAR